MPEAGFFQQRSGSPTGLAMVVLLHAAVFAALILVKGPDIARAVFTQTHVRLIPVPPEPVPVPPPPTPRQQVEHQQSFIDRVDPVVDTHVAQTNVDQTDHQQQQQQTFETTSGPAIETARAVLPPPVRRAAELISGDLQPPYPPSEERAQRGGSVRMRLTIGTDGRVSEVERLSATSDAFWRAAERQARTRWRFRPATEDGRPVAGSKVMTVTFRIEDI
jgi:protein TonB